MATAGTMDSAERPGLIKRIDQSIDRWVSAWNPYHPAKLVERNLEPAQVEESKIRKTGSRIAIFAMLAFLVWAVTAPLDAGGVTQGNLVVAGYRKAVQHPTGGVVTKVLVHEGSVVKQGEVLLRINPLETAATVSEVQQQYINILVSESRAKAEMLGRDIVWDPDLAALERLDPERVREAKSVQSQFFGTRRSQFGQQVRALESQKNGLRGSIESHRVQLGTLSDELKNIEKLASQGFVPKSQENETRRQVAEQTAALQTAQSEIGKIDAQIAQVRSEFLSAVAKELAELQTSREAAAPKLTAARFNQSLAEIRAPVAGTVVNLKAFTDGGVISGKEVVMEIVPNEGRMIVETKVPPSQIDKVRVGQTADVRFTSFNAVTTPVLQGIVKSVGVDKLKAMPGETLKEGDDYYLAQVEVPPEQLKRLEGKTLVAGMPVDVIVKRGERTFMSYLLKPLTDKLARAFRD
ncbi:HlyD family type I secretion periplasmic adaptor subunit [Sphingomonas sp. CJ20]